MKSEDLTGLKFGRLTAISKVDPIVRSNRKRTAWLCKCDCGNVIQTLAESLKDGNTKSCGCIQKDGTLKKNYSHGESRRITHEYKSWQKMKSRCYCKTDAKYPRYGARGIVVCDRWLGSYESFLKDMGRRPESKWSIGRINNDGNYEPGNCRWETRSEQAQNKSTTIYIEMDGIRLNLKQWCEKLNLKYEPTRRKIRNKNKTLQDLIIN
jgi:hypothetical protein